MGSIRCWAVPGAGQELQPWSYETGDLAPEEVEVQVETCGVCHSDLSVADNEWGNSSYPSVLGHEVIGRVVALGSAAKGLQVGQRVGVGWNSGSCMHCRQCLGGVHQLCAQAQPTILGHYGGFAEKVRTHWAWAIPLPENLDPASAGPLLCGGVTVFSPLATYGVPPSGRVGVVGIGGLGHMALKFANAWGCEVTALTSSESKADEARSFGAHRVISSRDPQAMAQAAGTLDLLLVTVNVTLNWDLMLGMLRPQGRMHVVGAVLEPLAISTFGLIFGQKQVSGSPTGSPNMISTMLEFAARHQIAPQVEYFPMSRINDAFAHLKAGKARYRIVLNADF
ncbi:NADPH-dependent aldehyde reductase Ahr [Planctomicrobium sp. SH664]|uniref:NADPH-dependent aldehyde reductase Ahr n=1 Tax=Planctomicrobium sp. SH664 TaxID=3448125 RepID=UPI003F5C726A